MNEKTHQLNFKLAPGHRAYAIGDIHGHAKMLDKMHQEIAMDLLDAGDAQIHIIYMGDYVDRGPDSKGVIDRLIERRDMPDSVQRTFLLGNHEQGMIDFMENYHGSNGSIWLDWGGIETLASYGIEFEGGVPLPAEREASSREIRHVIPPEHLEFLKTCVCAVEIDDFFFAHAGVNPQRSLGRQAIEDLYFIREPFLSWPEPLSHMIVHGHTKTEGEPEVLHHRINVDTGAYETGVLTAAVIEGNEVRFLQVQES